MAQAGIESEGEPTIALAGALISDTWGRLLLIHRNIPGKNQWEIIGGKFNPKESGEQTAVREAKEEADIDVELLGEAGSATYIDGSPKHYMWFNARIIAGTPRVRESIHDKIDYFSWEDMEKMGDELSLSVRHLLDARRKGLLRLLPS